MLRILSSVRPVLEVPWWAWAGFGAGVTALLLVDLLVLHRGGAVVGVRRAAVESLVWIALGLGFSLVVLGLGGPPAAGEYLSSYLLEKSLSVDNVVVWAVILSWFGVERRFQHRVLFWGVFGAIVFRGLFIVAGSALLRQFEWVGYGFAAVLLYTAVQMFRTEDGGFDPGSSRLVRWLSKVVPVDHGPSEGRLVRRVDGRRVATVLLLALVVVEVTDVLFAVDSVPAVLAVTRSPFVALTSNVMAVLGLRALYFVLADLRDRFHYLEEGIAVVLALVGLSVVLELGVPGLGRLDLPHWATLATIVVVLGVAGALSWLRPPASADDLGVDDVVVGVVVDAGPG
ncbi:MAG: TerC/Alx family metal homeostasis membrane protein, partial [Actinomycetes bacterium]